VKNCFCVLGEKRIEASEKNGSENNFHNGCEARIFELKNAKLGLFI
jgi:hypothetical protein